MELIGTTMQADGKYTGDSVPPVRLEHTLRQLLTFLGDKVVRYLERDRFVVEIVILTHRNPSTIQKRWLSPVHDPQTDRTALYVIMTKYLSHFPSGLSEIDKDA